MSRNRCISGPTQSRGHWLWQSSGESVDVRFVGRGPSANVREALRAVADSPLQVAWLRQLHSARVVVARTGFSGEADALITDQEDLALAIATADCVPILLRGRRRIAAVHAGWRGLLAGVVAETVRRMAVDPLRITAWIGPAIGACCYEVSAAVAQQIADASHTGVIVAGTRGRPHVDLPGAAAHQLGATGVVDIRRLIRCTRCDTGHLWSYRREGRNAGRNHAFIWSHNAS